MEEWLQEAVSGEGQIPVPVLVTRLVIAFLLGCVAALVHHFASGRPKGRVDRQFLATLVLLSLLIALVTLVIGNNIARAFSLVGALAIVRFRTVVEDTRDTAFVIYAVVMGMAAGTGYWLGPVVCTPLVCLVAWFFRAPAAEPAPVASEAILTLRFGAGKPPDEKVASVLAEHLGLHRMTGLSTARGGSALDVSYAIRLPTPERSFALVAELNRLDGVQGVELKQNV
jgi:hypothetical protein